MDYECPSGGPQRRLTAQAGHAQMIDRKHLLSDLRRLRRRLEDDLRGHHSTGAARSVVEAEWREAFDAKRTAEAFAAFFDAALDQAAAHWILAAVFVRFLEDNRLIARPMLSGPGERLELARERQQAWFRAHPLNSDAEYLTAAFSEMTLLPGLSGVFDQAHNPLFRLPLSGDGAMALIAFSGCGYRRQERSSTISPTPIGARAGSAISTRTCPRRRASATRCCRPRNSSKPLFSIGPWSPRSVSSAMKACG
jgi:hypothetical protein